jgi:hypothetical protein
MIAQTPADRRKTGGDGDATPVGMSGRVQKIARSIVAINRDEAVLMAELNKRRGSRHLAQIKPRQCCHTSLSQEQPDRSSRGRSCSAMRRRKAAFVADMRSDPVFSIGSQGAPVNTFTVTQRWVMRAAASIAKRQQQRCWHGHVLRLAPRPAACPAP